MLLDHDDRDTSGRSFLLSYIDFQKEELRLLQEQLERYAEDFQSLLAADDTPVEARRVSQQIRLAQTHCSNYERLVGQICMKLARHAGCDEMHSVKLAEAAQAVLSMKAGARYEATEQISIMALEIVMYRSKWFNGQCLPAGVSGQAIPLASRIFNLAEYAASFIETCHPSLDHSPLSQKELAELLTLSSGKIFDPRLIEAIKHILSEDLAI